MPTDEFDTEIGEDDVLVPIAGILDVLDNYAFVRTTGYLAGPSDVYVSLGQVKNCLLYTSPSPRDQRGSRMPSSA